MATVTICSNFGSLFRVLQKKYLSLMLRKIEGKRRRSWQRMRWSDSITDSMDNCKDLAAEQQDHKRNIAID